jgi:uncharacterized membrane protein
MTTNSAPPTPTTNPGPPVAGPLPVAPPAPSAPPGGLRATLASFFTSKKFLVALAAGLTAVVRLIVTAAGVDVDQDALDRIFLALLTYVGAQGITDVGKGAQQVNVGAVVASFQGALGELLRSKKFLASAAAAFVAVAAPLARRFGIELDATSLDRIFVAILAYVGVQGVTEFGKGSAQLAAGANTGAGGPPGTSGPPRGAPSPDVRVGEPR